MTGAGSRDIGGEGVQQAMLKLLEGREVFVPLNVTQHWNKHDFVQVDTRDILFICRSGNRSSSATSLARQSGLARARNVRGGMIAWSGGGLPVKKDAAK